MSSEAKDDSTVLLNADISLVDRAGDTGGDETGEHGAAMVEMALVFSLLIMLLVGTVTAAIALSQNNSIENAAREASRFGATLPFDSSWLATVRDVARNAAHGDLDASVPGQTICVALVGPGGTQSLTDTGGAPAFSSSPCFADGRPSEEVRVQVVTGRDTTIEAVLFSIDVSLSAPAAARYERS